MMQQNEHWDVRQAIMFELQEAINLLSCLSHLTCLLPFQPLNLPLKEVIPLKGRRGKVKVKCSQVKSNCSSYVDVSIKTMPRFNCCM